MPPTKVRLAEEMRLCAVQDPSRAELFEALAKKADAGDYDDYESESVTPIGDLAKDLAKIGTKDAMWLRRRAIRGDFDGTKEESDAWAKKQGLIE